MAVLVVVVGWRCWWPDDGEIAVAVLVVVVGWRCWRGGAGDGGMVMVAMVAVVRRLRWR